MHVPWIDIVILIVYLTGTVLLGLWVGRGQRDISDYLLGGRDLPWWAVLGSIVATETSTVTFLSIPGVAFAAGGDLRFLQLAMGYIVGRWLVVLLLLPQYFRGQLYSAYQVLHRRFGGTTKNAASAIFIVTRTVADGLRLYLTAIVLDKMFGLPLPACIGIIGVATIVYTYFGGMKSVVWNDCIQLVIYLIGAIVAGGLIVQSLPGGWSQLMDFAQEHNKLRMFDFVWSPDQPLAFVQEPRDFWGRFFTQPYTLWAGLIGGTFLSLASHGADQLMVQRYLCARSERDASRALILSGFFVFVQFALFLLVGVGLAAFYAEYPPDSPFSRSDEVFAAFIVHHVPVGITGVILAAVFAAAMSTLSSSLNSSATAAVNDLYRPLLSNEPAAGHLLWASRLLTVGFGLAQIGVGIGAERVIGFFTRSESAVEAVVNSVLAIAGFTTGILLGLFFLGTLTKRTSQKAALAGLLVGFGLLTVIKFGGSVVALPMLADVQKIAWPWLTVIGTGTTFLVGYTTSFLWPRNTEQ